MAHHQLCDGIWYTDFVEAGDRPVLGLAAGSRASILIDGGNSPTHIQEMLTLASSLPIPPPRAICLTHWHWDHTFGLAHAGLPVVAYEDTRIKLDWMRKLSWTDAAMARRVEEGTETEFCRENILIEYPDNDRKIIVPPVDITFGDWISIDLGGVAAEILHVESDHTADCCIVHLPEPSVVFLGDCLYLNMDREPWHRTRRKTLALLDQLLSLNARWYIPAHHPLYSGEAFRDYVFFQRQLCEIVGNSLAEDGMAGRFENVFSRKPTGDEWDELAAYLEGNRRGQQS